MYLDRNAYLLMAIDEKRALDLLGSHLDTLPPGKSRCCTLVVSGCCCCCFPAASVPHHPVKNLHAPIFVDSLSLSLGLCAGCKAHSVVAFIAAVPAGCCRGWLLLLLPPPGAVVPGLLDAMSVCESKGDEADREVWRHRLFNYLDKVFAVSRV